MDVRAARPLYGMRRGKALEIITSGVIGVRLDGRLRTPETAAVRMVSRSILKPWQFLAADVFGAEDFWAIGFSSASAQPLHLEALTALMKATGGTLETLVCGASYPHDAKLAAKLEAEEKPKNRLYHFCCGKHLVLQYACRKNGWDALTYHQIDNPVQIRLQELVGEILEETPEWVTDSCGLPSLYCSMAGHLKLWADLGASTQRRKCELKDLWLRNARLVGGFGRLDSDIVEASGARVLAKEGADGVLAVQTVAERGERPMTVIIKLVQGFHPRDMGLALWSVLKDYESELPEGMKAVLTFLDRQKNKKWVRPDQAFVTQVELSQP